MAKDKGGKSKGRPSPEEIAEIRRLRKVKKEEERQKLIERGIDPDEVNKPPELRFIKRKLLQIPSSEVEAEAGTEPESLRIKIMSYNMLAQALIRRKLFPTSGTALKWSTRSQVLISEIKYYDPEIMCLQEVDFIQFNSYWKVQFDQLGYDCKYYRSGSKNHGLAIAYKRDIFINTHLSHINYDKEETSNLKPSCITNNVGLLASLTFTPKVLSKYKKISKKGVIIGTTHLFWHPFGTYERTRQTYIILKKVKEFQNTLATIEGSGDWYTLFAGDFNSQPYDVPYLSITSKPVKYVERGKLVLGCSLSYQYSKNRGKVDQGDEGEGVEVEEEDEEQEVEEEEEEEEGGNVEKYGTNQPKDPVPETFDFTDEQLQTVHDMEDLHNSLDVRATSLYSVGYEIVDPKNSGIDNDRKEPFFSNWAHAWRGLLDYIFVISKWDMETDNSQVDTIEQVQKQFGIKLVGLLQLPHPDDMGPEPSGQPRLGQFPSDHLCIMSEIELS
ncbi:RNA exonuclease Ngl2p [[Candida] railenensis]|uniref:RNA exonuclease Ngl2p n=1 Tax=[Candida] railenensis TaxID=45579 RepID=A0A9P0QU06_9ASCO|nr:RNA exonuclease Ngl2p [[Candida] railenensis]